jgi:hypothetical protein
MVAFGSSHGSAASEEPVGDRVAWIDQHEDPPEDLLASNLVIGPPGQVPPGKYGENDLNRHDECQEQTLLVHCHVLTPWGRAYALGVMRAPSGPDCNDHPF